MSDPKEAYEAVLADLRAQREQLDQTIALLERQSAGGGTSTPNGMLGISSSTVKPSTPGAPVTLQSDTFFGMSLPDAIRKYLAMAKRKQSPKEIMNALEAGGFQHTSKRFYGTVYTSLTRAAEVGDVVKVNDDWGLADWYPGLRAQKRKTEKATEPGESDDPKDA